MTIDMRSWRGGRRVACLLAPLAVSAALLTAVPAAAAPAEGALVPVVQAELAGDLVMAGNSNLLVAGGWRSEAQAVADVDGESSQLCVPRRYVPAACADDSSSATLDIPAGAHIVAARLYVDTTLSTVVSPIRVRLDGPADGYDYTELAAATPGVPKLAEYAGTAGRAAPMRQAVWDVTGYVQTAGGGSYTVADIMFERAGAYLPYASWAIVAAYELDPATDVATLTPEQQARFAPRAITWYDGFAISADGSVDVPVTGFQVRAGEPAFGKAFHLVAHAQHRGADNLLFGGQPLGNNVAPGNSPAPLGVVVGDDPACNSTTEILNDSICVLGALVTSKSPGADAYVAARDGVTPASGSGVDMDVTRIPDRFFVPGATSSTLTLQVNGPTPVATGMLAVSVDLPGPPAEAAP